MLGQYGIRRKNGVPPIRYEAVAEGLGRVADFARTHYATVHMPRIGCGLSGGTWDKIEPIIEVDLVSKGVAVVVYDLAR
ncbi:hypothetical protein CCAX7_59850 [Capsulimonas corticalis]|uniref:Uncharacterized protein n=1 Tax=Capsulimonas corticalis TaxID=2219043 RepID=A0A402CZL4_9BACT|nr:hypothetical protein [Capsulimonas corticalis]BDI33934.1 hypothetical protein CCAX7_59850 [Capsulimonas corticalis]